MDHPSYLIKMISLMQIIVTTGAELLVCDGIFFIKKHHKFHEVPLHRGDNDGSHQVEDQVLCTCYHHHKREFLSIDKN